MKTIALALWIGLSSTALWAQEALQDQIKQDFEKLVQQAAEDNYDPAQLKAMQDKLLPVIDQPWARTYRDQFIKIRKESQEYAALKPSQQKLLLDPDNAEANSRLARYYLFIKEDWARALPHLSKGQDKSLKEAALAELSGDPKEALKAATGYLKQARECLPAQKSLYTKHVLEIAKTLGGDQKRILETAVATIDLNPKWQLQWSLTDEQWSEVKQFRSKCYLLVTDKMVYSEAKAWCTKHGGSLVNIKDEAENAFVHKLRPEPQATVWLAGTWVSSENRNFIWADGTPFRYTNWGKDPVQPSNTGGNESKVSMMSDGYWNDAPASERYGFVCEWKIPP